VKIKVKVNLNDFGTGGMVSMIFELRIYYTYPGKLEALHKRFSDITFRLFQKHGLKIVDFWDDALGEERLYYILEFKDMEMRNDNFDAFLNDPEWIGAEKRSVANGPIVEKVESFFMNRVAFK
jgi:hypothetical protein